MILHSGNISRSTSEGLSEGGGGALIISNTTLDCLCEAYHPTALLKGDLDDNQTLECSSGFKGMLESYGIFIDYDNAAANQNDNNQFCRKTYLDALPEDYCGFPWDLDPFAPERPNYLCGLESDDASCEERSFQLLVQCKWFDDHSSCAAHPVIEIDSGGYCKTFMTENECSDASLDVTGHCVWHEKKIGRNTTFPACCDSSVPSVSTSTSAPSFSVSPSAAQSSFPTYIPSASPSESFSLSPSVSSPSSYSLFTSTQPSVARSSLPSSTSTLPPSLLSGSTWCNSIGLEYIPSLNEKTRIQFLHLSCGDIFGIDAMVYNREEMLLSRTLTDDQISMIDEKCCVSHNQPTHDNGVKAPSPMPSTINPMVYSDKESSSPSIMPTSSRIHNVPVEFPSASPTQESRSMILPTRNPTNDTMKEIGNGSLGDDSGSKSEEGSRFLLVASAPLLFMFASYIWKSRRRILGKKSFEHTDSVEDDPTKFEHVQPIADLEDHEMKRFDIII